MSRRNSFALLALLLVTFAIVVYWNVRTPEASGLPATLDLKYQPITVENPALRLDLLEHLKTVQYEGPKRNIFSASVPLPPAPRKIVVAPPPRPAPTGPPPVPPLVIPAKFFGYVTDAATGTRRAFFSEGEDVYVVGVGDVLLGRFRLLQIGNTTAELEETASGRRTTVALQEPGPS
jgi:hypothetical protein